MTEEPSEAERKRRLREEVFGDVLPDTTSDEEREDDSSEKDEWLRRQVPPHHG